VDFAQNDADQFDCTRLSKAVHGSAIPAGAAEEAYPVKRTRYIVL
jgi:hypothetical protein